MSYELAMKKAGLPLIRCFIQSVEAVVPYIKINAAASQLKLKNATTLPSNSKPTLMENPSKLSVKLILIQWSSLFQRLSQPKAMRNDVIQIIISKSLIKRTK